MIPLDIRASQACVSTGPSIIYVLQNNNYNIYQFWSDYRNCNLTKKLYSVKYWRSSTKNLHSDPESSLTKVFPVLTSKWYSPLGPLSWSGGLQLTAIVFSVLREALKPLTLLGSIKMKNKKKQTHSGYFNHLLNEYLNYWIIYVNNINHSKCLFGDREIRR